MDTWSNGDLVRRVEGYHGGMTPGRRAVVIDAGNGCLDGFGGGHDKRNFVLVKAAPAAAARKDDSGKLDMNLLDDLPRALKAVVEVMQWAITDKQPVPYVRGSWLGVHADRYRAAIKRHERSAAEQATAPGAVAARFQQDDETKLLHLAHTACSALMALENTMREMETHK